MPRGETRRSKDRVREAVGREVDSIVWTGFPLRITTIRQCAMGSGSLNEPIWPRPAGSAFDEPTGFGSTGLDTIRALMIRGTTSTTDTGPLMRVSRSLPGLPVVLAACGCGGGVGDHPWNAFDAERPIAARDSVFIEELTWMEVRDRIAGGATTAIVATGGIEQNGPYVVTGKHNVVLRATTEAIARRLGDALVAPIIDLVPEGDHDPPTGHMRYPGTISLTADTFEMLLTDVARSLAASGFTDVLMIGDSGGNQRGMAAVAERWNAAPPHSGVRLHHIPEYYREDLWSYEQLKELGVHQLPDVQSASRAGIHDDYHYDAIMATVDPGSIRTRERRAAGEFAINGVSLDPLDRTIAHGYALIARRAEITVAAFRRSLAP